MKLEKLEKTILKILKQEKRGMTAGALMRNTGVSPKNKRAMKKALAELEQKHKIAYTDRRYTLPQNLKLTECEMTKVSSGYGFAEGEDARFFIPGRLLKGAMQGDIVAVHEISHMGDSPEGEVVQILKHNKEPFVGTLKELPGGGFGVVPDDMSNFTFAVKRGDEKGGKDGDKVSAYLSHKSDSHFDHVASVYKVYGSADRAQVCTWALLDHYGIKKRFARDTLDSAKEILLSGVKEEDKKCREDFTSLSVFTIDGAESKDLDDAISLERTKEGYRLGVHIADVSHYVTGKSPLDNEAYDRGTSVYYADQVIPMLPKEISNGICSLNPNEEKLTFSAVMELDSAGNLLRYSFKKSFINSKVKGVYSEVNAILERSAPEDILKKYQGVVDNIFLMEELADKLMENRRRRHALEIESSEAKIVVDKNGDPTDILTKARGKSEQIIEEFMVLANQAAARVSVDMGVPFLYRVHQSPSEKKIGELRSFLSLLGIQATGLQKEKITPGDLDKILQDAMGKDTQSIIHMQVLRSLEKARYDTVEVGHFGLALDFYSHFTSPIRRYPDLVIHRILSDVVAGEKPEDIERKYTRFVANAAAQSSLKEQQATECERACEDVYKAQYMRQFIGETFTATVNGVTNFGIYVALPNTVEGLVKVDEFPKGAWAFQEGLGYTEGLSGKRLTLGQKVTVTLTGTDVSLGQIDFSMKQA